MLQAALKGGKTGAARCREGGNKRGTQGGPPAFWSCGNRASVASITAALRPAVEDESDTTCVVCLDADRSHLYVPCGHKCVCAACAARVMAGDALCPVCRMAATAVVKVFG